MIGSGVSPGESSKKMTSNQSRLEIALIANFVFMFVPPELIFVMARSSNVLIVLLVLIPVMK